MSTQRSTILACACDLYLADGLDGFSMRKLARAVGVTAPALYRHYESKEKVLVDVVGEAYKLFAQYLYRALEGRTPAERFRMAGDGYFNFALEHPRMYEMLYTSPDVMGLTELSEETAAQACAIGQFWNDRVRECMDAGILEPGDPERVSLTLWAHAHGLISLYLRGLLDVGEEEFRTMALGSGGRVLGGIATGEYAERIRKELAGGLNGGAGVKRRRSAARPPEDVNSVKPA